MDQSNDPASKPVDATKATEGQREEQELWDRQHEDPEAPGRHQTQRQVPGENDR